MTVKEWLGEDNQLGIDIWERKYRYENETFDEWLDRVSGGNRNLRKLIVEKKFLFGGRILANRGLDKKGVKCTLSNCYVLTPPEDNIPSIYEAARKLADTFKMGGGCGLDIGKLAPRGAKVNNTAKVTSGAVSFMDLFNLTTELIGQNGRRGALMISIPCDHPDLEEFINIKTDLNKINKANISIRITDDFMKAVEENRMWKLSFTREQTGEVIEKEVLAKRIFRMICENNWDYAEPGVLFWDRITGWNLLSEDPNFEYAGTNPCAEEPLPAGGSCLLGAINLAEFVTEDSMFDTEGFTETVHYAVKALNEVLDEGLPLHPLQEQRDSVRNWRQIGLGIMGLGDMLIKLGIRYGSPEAVRICDLIGTGMAAQAIMTSSELARFNETYPMYHKEFIINSLFFDYNTHDYGNPRTMVSEWGLRNSQLLTIAPTGTLSTMLGISGGIEPIFAKSYTRKTESLHGEDVYYKVYPKIVKEYMDIHGLTDESELPDFFVTAQELDYHERIDMQAIWQDHIDASISSTVNVPNDFTVEEVEDMYMYAWKKGLKGLTMFRDGCKRAGVLTTEKPKNASEEPTEAVESESEVDFSTYSDYWPVPIKRGEVIKVNDNCVGKKRTLHTGCGTLHCEAFFDPVTGDLLETYLSKGSAGGCNNFMVGLSRLISLSARGGVSVEAIVDQLRSSGTCPSYAVRSATKHDTSKGSSCPVAVGNALMEMYEEMYQDLGYILLPDSALEEFNKCGNGYPLTIDEFKKALRENDPLKKMKPKCPKCGGYLVFEGGCNTCKDCGWSKCD